MNCDPYYEQTGQISDFYQGIVWCECKYRNPVEEGVT